MQALLTRLAVVPHHAACLVHHDKRAFASQGPSGHRAWYHTNWSPVVRSCWHSLAVTQKESSASYHCLLVVELPACARSAVTARGTFLVHRAQGKDMMSSWMWHLAPEHSVCLLDQNATPIMRAIVPANSRVRARRNCGHGQPVIVNMTMFTERPEAVQWPPGRKHALY